MTGDLKQRVHARLLHSPAVDELDARDRSPIRARLAELLRDEAPLLPLDRFETTLTELTREVAGLGPLEPLLAEPEVTEVMVNGPGRAFVERRGALEPVALSLDASAIVRLVERVVAPLGLRLDRASPIVDARLPDGSRLHAMIPPLAVDGPCVTIRRFRPTPVGLPAFGLDVGPAAFLSWWTNNPARAMTADVRDFLAATCPTPASWDRRRAALGHFYRAGIRAGWWTVNPAAPVARARRGDWRAE